MAIIAGTRRFKTWRGFYDFAVDGGGTGLPQTIVLRSNDGVIPNGSVITGGYVNVVTSCLSATGTMALTVQAANDIVTAVGQANWAAAVRSIIPAGTGATSILLTADQSPSLVIATAAFTAGKFTLVLEFI